MAAVVERDRMQPTGEFGRERFVAAAVEPSGVGDEKSGAGAAEVVDGDLHAVGAGNLHQSFSESGSR
jgi:hypothetical protein